MRCSAIVTVVLILSIFQYGWCHDEFDGQEWSKDFAVEMRGDMAVAELVATSKGFNLVKRKVWKCPDRDIDNCHVYQFRHEDACGKEHRCRRHAADLVKRLMESPHILKVEQQYNLGREKREFLTREALHERGDEDSVDQDVIDGINKRELFTVEEMLGEEEAFAQADMLYEKRKKDEEKYVHTLKKRKRMNFNDPSFNLQWHLDNVGELGRNPGLDINVQPAWRKGYNGAGVAITVVDDGVDTLSKDLRNRIDLAASGDFNDLNDTLGDPRSPDKVIDQSEDHGTQCAGIIGAEANNSFCGVGIAYKSNIGGIRILAGPVTDLMEAYAFLHNNQYISIYSCSWGPKDNGMAMEMPHYYTQKALDRGIVEGRGGRGSIFVYAAGNGRGHGDNCGADGYVNSPYTIAFSSLNEKGESPYYDEACAAILATTPVGGMHSMKDFGKYDPKITTTAINGGCVNHFTGTSAAAPLGSGCLALTLQANPDLTWRDVQHIITRSTRLPSGDHRGWQRNAAGHHVSHKFGFGLLNCAAMVKNAQRWKNVGPRQECTAKPEFATDGKTIRGGKTLVLKFDGSTCKNVVSKLEHVVLEVKLEHSQRGMLSIWLKSPAGTIARLLGARKKDKSRDMDQHFSSVLHWDESPRGEWTVEIRDEHKKSKFFDKKRGTLSAIKLKFFGTKSKKSSLERGDGNESEDLVESKLRWIKDADTYETFNSERNAALQDEEDPDHKDVIEIERRIIEASRRGGAGDMDELLQEARKLSDNEDVSDAELRNVLDLVKREIVKLERKGGNLDKRRT